MSSGTGWGITPQGFVLPQLTDIQAEINQTLVSLFGANINLQPESIFGQLSGIFAEREALVWQAMQDVYNSQNPDEAFGASLDNVGALRGIPRLQATFSQVQNVRLFGTSGTPIPTTLQVSVNGSPTSLFSPTTGTTLGAGQSCVQTLTFSATAASGTFQLALAGNETALINWNDTLATIQAKFQALEFASGTIVTGSIASGLLTFTFTGAGTGGFMVQPLIVVTENTLETSAPAAITLTPAITTPGLDQANVVMQATVTGPVIANAGTLTTIATPITGLTAVLNTQDATVGSNVETDNAYRTRMAEELQLAGAGTVEAIRSQLLEVAGVTTVIVFENTTDVTDGNDLPPHSFEAYVQGGDTATIAQTIWESKPAGIATYGNTSYTITDSQGLEHVINFSRPVVVPVYIAVTITPDATYPADGDTLVKEALVNYGNSLGIGQELIVIPNLVAQLAPQISGIPGIQDAVIYVSTSPGPTLPDNITPLSYEILSFDTSRVSVSS
jgi:uncharacterized phage protein gp47/JayE